MIAGESPLGRTKPRIVIPLSQHFGLRYFMLSGLVERLSRDMEVTFLVAWDDPELLRDLNSAGFHAEKMAQLRSGASHTAIRRWRTALGEKTMGAATPMIDRRRYRSMPRSFRHRVYDLKPDLRRKTAQALSHLPGFTSLVHAAESFAFERWTTWHDLESQLHRLAPDAVVSATPFILPEMMLCRVARKMGIRLIGTILSFDNLSSRGKMDVAFDAYIVWNRYMAQEATRIYGVPPGRVVTAGAIQMDFYARPGWVDDKKEFLEHHGLTPGRPLILFAGGAVHIAPREPEHLLDLDRIVQEMPEPARPRILFRPHPVDDVGRWRDTLARCANVSVAPSWSVKNQAEGRIGEQEIRSLASVLAHCDLHISTSSTMSLDGAVFDRPQIGLAYDSSGRLQRCMEELYDRDHFLPLTRSGAIRIVRSRDELRKAVLELLADPSQGKDERAAMVLDVCGAPIGTAVDNVAASVTRFVLER